MTMKTNNKITIIAACFAIYIATIFFVKSFTTSSSETSNGTLVLDTCSIEEPYIETRSSHKLDKAAAIQLIKAFEGFSDSVYKCPSGVPTVGWGTTKTCLTELHRQKYVDTTFYVWGHHLEKADADILLSKTIDMIYKMSLKNVPDLKYLSPKAQAAFISWAYQCGIGSVKAKTGIIGVFPDIIDHIDDKMLYDILVERAYYSKYKARRLKEAALIIGIK